ncbi:MAG: hypothetical protein ACK4M7_09820, partial [Burkholderiales bacterium]
IKDNNANTPLHTVALCSSELSVYDFVFPYYLKEAKAANFNFSTLGQNGQAIIHMAASTVHSHPSFGKRSKIRKLLEIVPNIDLDVLSSSGSTALAYAINWMHLEEAEILLTAGANPRIYGNLERSPLAMIDKHLQDISEIIAEDEESKNLESLSLEKQFNRLLQKVITAINQRGMDAYDILRQHNIAGITFSDNATNDQDKICSREKSTVSAGLDISPAQKQAFDNLKYLATLFEIKEQVYNAEKIELAKTSAKQLYQLKDKILTISRTLKKNPQGSTSQEATLRIKQNNNPTPIIVTNPSSVNPRIIKEIGIDQDIFINTCFIGQKRLETLENLGAKERQQLISKLFNLDYFVNLIEKAKDTRKEFISQKENYELIRKAAEAKKELPEIK